MDDSQGSDQAPRLVYPVLVTSTQIAHLAITTLDEYGADYRALCPAGSLITSPLRLITSDESFVWCGACTEWAEAVGITLPQSR